jgi:hypothetical protein
VITGVPTRDAPAKSEIKVYAYAADAGGSRLEETTPLMRSFVVPVLSNDCSQSENETLAWCDSQVDVQAAGQYPSKKQSLAFAFQTQAVTEGKSQCDEGSCILQFDRLRDKHKTYGYFDPSKHKIYPWNDDVTKEITSPPAATIINAINASKVFLSGSVLIRKHVAGCPSWSWRVVTQAEESSGNLYYGPSDVSAFCYPDDPRDSTALIVLPVHAIWARVYGYPADTYDPSWKPNSPPPGGHECGSTQPSKTSFPSQQIRPCDANKDANPLLKLLYSKPSRWIYNRQAEPGVSQGSISIAPIDAATKATFDLQAYESSLLGPGWFGFQTMYEHDRKAADDLNSLTAAYSYDLRLANPSKPSPWLHGAAWGARTAGSGDCFESDGNSSECSPPIVGIRPLELMTRVGGEWSPDSFSAKSAETGKTEYLGRDANLVMGSTLRVPIVFSSTSQPSQVTVTPVLGLEGGVRITSHDIGTGTTCAAKPLNPTCATQPGQIFRQVAGVDASTSLRYNLSHNFFGDRPFTLDFSYRIRRLSYAEPFANEMYVIHSVDAPFEGQSTSSRAYTRITFIAPFSAYVQGRITWQHGSLPPLFSFVGNQVTLGLTFSNPGLSEH